MKLIDFINQLYNLVLEFAEEKEKVSENKPTLTTQQKTQIKSLMDSYFSNKSLFKYDGTYRRESYAYPQTVSNLDDIQGCMYNSKYLINCGLLAQMVWMGRNIEDYTSTPSIAITKAFDWGYYFNFKSAKKAYGIMKNSSTYYSGNTYENDSNGTSFITFDNAAAMAQELYALGCEINYSDADIGDLVFYRSEHISNSETDGLEQSSFRYITHVGIVYDKDEEGNLTIFESSSAYTAALGKSGLGDNVTKFGNVRGAGQEQRVVMCARHPVAFGLGGNVPDEFKIYRGTEVQS